jgi:hypothetical protein
MSIPKDLFPLARFPTATLFQNTLVTLAPPAFSYYFKRAPISFKILTPVLTIRIIPFQISFSCTVKSSHPILTVIYFIAVCVIIKITNRNK